MTPVLSPPSILGGRQRTLAIAATTITVGTAAGLAIANLAYLGVGESATYVFTLVFVAVVLDLGAVGGILALRRPENRVGWLLVAAGLAAAVTFGGGNYAELDTVVGPGRLPLVEPLAWVSSWTADPMIAMLIVFLPLVYPSGHLPGRRWRIIGVITIVGTAINMVADATRPGPLQSADWIANPVVLPDPLGSWTQAAGGLGLLVAALVFVLVVANLGLRFRRSAGTERQQLKWFLFVAAVAGVSFATSNVVNGPISNALFVVGLLSIALLPVAIGIAILRYRLYEIDRVVSRTLGWTVVTIVLVLVFASVNLVLDDVLASITQAGTLAVAASTLVVFALFQPLRHRVQALVDGRFDRRRYQAEQIASGFAARLRDQLDADRVRRELADVVEATVAPAMLGVWIRGDRPLPNLQR